MSRAIAIDGPAGAGKSTIAKIVAKELGFMFVDTGAMFRAMALFYIRKGIDVTNHELLDKYVSDIKIDLMCSSDGSSNRVFLNGEEVTKYIRTEEVSKKTSLVAQNDKVVEKQMMLQRQIGEKNNVVMDGRNIGAFVLPNADLKIYLCADVEERAERRYNQLLKKGDKPIFENVLCEVKKRDIQDAGRRVAPLKRAMDAIEVDTTNKTIEEAANIIIELAREKFV